MSGYDAFGLAVAAALAAGAWSASRSPAASAHADDYGMTPATHRRYALAGLAFFVLIAMLAATRYDGPENVALGGVVVVALLYATSFLRGFSSSDDA